MININIYNQSGDKRSFQIDTEELRKYEKYEDTLNISKGGDYTIERYIHLNKYNGFKIERKLEKGKLKDFKLFEGKNTIEINLPKSNITLKYSLKNKFVESSKAIVKNELAVTVNEIYLKLSEKTDVHDVENMININNQGINLKVAEKVGKNEVISAINLSPETIKLKSEKIQLEGLTTINNNFKVLSDGSIETQNAKINGDLITEKGIYNTFVFYSTNLDNGNYLNHMTSFYTPVDINGRYEHIPIKLSAIVPKNFEIETIQVAINYKELDFKIYNKDTQTFEDKKGKLNIIYFLKGISGRELYLNEFNMGFNPIIYDRNNTVKNIYKNKDFIELNGDTEIISNNLINNIDIKVNESSKSFDIYVVDARAFSKSYYTMEEMTRKEILEIIGKLNCTLLVGGYLKK